MHNHTSREQNAATSACGKILHNHGREIQQFERAFKSSHWGWISHVFILHKDVHIKVNSANSHTNPAELGKSAQTNMLPVWKDYSGNYKFEDSPESVSSLFWMPWEMQPEPPQHVGKKGLEDAEGKAPTPWNLLRTNLLSSSNDNQVIANFEEKILRFRSNLWRGRSKRRGLLSKWAPIAVPA